MNYLTSYFLTLPVWPSRKREGDPWHDRRVEYAEFIGPVEAGDAKWLVDGMGARVQVGDRTGHIERFTLQNVEGQIVAHITLWFNDSIQQEGE